MTKPKITAVLTSEQVRSSTSALVSAANGLGMEKLLVGDRARSRNLVIVIQGYFHNKESVIDWRNYLSDTSGLPAEYVAVWYDYWNKSFDLVGAEIFNLVKNDYPYAEETFDNIVVIGYSMGGLVARKFLSMGFPYTKLITLCAPHHGIFDYIASKWAGDGAYSMRKDSPYLIALNENPTDSDNRYKHLYLAYNYHRGKDYPDDCVLWDYSGTGALLGDRHSYVTYTWTYSGAGGLNTVTDIVPHVLPPKKEYYKGTAEPIVSFLKSLI
jgi:hypothetical protein